MKKVILALVGAAILGLGSTSAVFASDYGTITVDGYAQAKYTDNEAIVMVTNHTEKDALADAKVENDRVSAQFRESLRELGIEDKDIHTENYQINERERRIGNNDSNEYKKTYVVSNTLKVTVNDKTKTSQVIDKAAAVGIKDVRLAKLDLNSADKAAQRQELLIKAAKDARQKADAIAAALGTRVVGVDSLNVDNYNYARPMMAGMKLAAYDRAVESQSSIEYGDDTQDMHVNVVFRVK